MLMSQIVLTLRKLKLFNSLSLAETEKERNDEKYYKTIIRIIVPNNNVFVFDGDSSTGGDINGYENR